MDLTKHVYNDMQKEIVNENVLDPKLRDINDVVIDTLRKLSMVTMIGYKRENINPRELFEIEFRDDIIKRTKDRKKNEVDYSIDLNENKVDILKCYYILSPSLVSKTKLDIVKTNTKYHILQFIDSLDEVFETEILNDILNHKDKHSSDVEEDMVIESPILIPRLVNDAYYVLDGRKFYSAFYMQRESTMTSTGKLRVTNIAGVYKGDDEVSSYIYEKNGVIKYMFLGVEVNPFVFLDREGDKLPEVHELFPEYFESKKTPNSEEGQLIYETYNAWIKKDKKKFKKKYKKEELKKEKNKQLSEDKKIKNKFYAYEMISKKVNPDEIIDAIYAVLDPKNQDVLFDIHKSMRKFLKIEIIESFPHYVYNKRYSVDEIKKRYNINPECVILLMKTQKQYSSTTVQSANTIDIFNRFAYVSVLVSGDVVTDDNRRRFRKKHIGLLDPIATSTSSNLGLSGMMLFSIPDKHIKR